MAAIIATCSVHQTVFGKMEEYRVVIVYVSKVRILEDFISHNSFPESCVLERFACPCFKTLPLGIFKVRCGCSYRLASCLVSQLQLHGHFRQRSVRSELCRKGPRNCDCYRQNQTVNQSGMFDYWDQHIPNHHFFSFKSKNDQNWNYGSLFISIYTRTYHD